MSKARIDINVLSHEEWKLRMKALALDPSVHYVGWATLDMAKKGPKVAWKWGQWNLVGNNYQMKLVDLVQHIQQEIGPFEFLITEWPAFFSSERGQVAAHLNYTIDLAGICMYVAGRLGKDHRNHFAITANQWKGTVPKEVTQRHFIRSFKRPLKGLTEHTVDAIMLLRYWAEHYAIHLPNFAHNANRVLKLLTVPS